jgi:hypothetical protein
LPAAAFLADEQIDREQKSAIFLFNFYCERSKKNASRHRKSVIKRAPALREAELLRAGFFL